MDKDRLVDSNLDENKSVVHSGIHSHQVYATVHNQRDTRHNRYRLDGCDMLEIPQTRNSHHSRSIVLFTFEIFMNN